MNIIDYNLDHLLKIDIDFDKYPIFHNNITVIANLLKQGITGTIIDSDNNPLAIISVLKLHEGVATVYIIPDKKAHTEKKKSFTKRLFNKL